MNERSLKNDEVARIALYNFLRENGFNGLVMPIIIEAEREHAYIDTEYRAVYASAAGVLGANYDKKEDDRSDVNKALFTKYGELLAAVSKEVRPHPTNPESVIVVWETPRGFYSCIYTDQNGLQTGSEDFGPFPTFEAAKDHAGSDEEITPWFDDNLPF